MKYAFPQPNLNYFLFVNFFSVKTKDDFFLLSGIVGIRHLETPLATHPETKAIRKNIYDYYHVYVVHKKLL